MQKAKNKANRKRLPGTDLTHWNRRLGGTDLTHWNRRPGQYLRLLRCVQLTDSDWGLPRVKRQIGGSIPTSQSVGDARSADPKLPAAEGSNTGPRILARSPSRRRGDVGLV